MSTKHLEPAYVLHFDTAHYLDSLCSDVRRALWSDQTSTYREGQPYRLPTQEDLAAITHKLVKRSYENVTIARAFNNVFTDSYEVEQYVLARLDLETTMVSCPTDECIAFVCFDHVWGRVIGATSWDTGLPQRDILQLHETYADFIEVLREAHAESPLQFEDLSSLWREWKTTQ